MPERPTPAKRVEQIALARTTCPRCGARPSDWCSSSSGRIASALHSSRTDALRPTWLEAYGEGYQQGFSDWLTRGTTNLRNDREIEAAWVDGYDEGCGDGYFQAKDEAQA